jgi:hypothetical protein
MKERECGQKNAHVVQGGDMQCREVNRYKAGGSGSEVQDAHRVPGGLYTRILVQSCSRLDTMRAKRVVRFNVKRAK